MKFTSSQIVALLRLADLQSFTQAAESLGITQPTLSRTIQQVEEVFGAKLFDRDTRKIALNSVGAEMLPIARRLLNELDVAEREFAQVAKGQQGLITVACLPSIAAGLVPRAIARFRPTHPDIDILIHDSLSESVLTHVTDGLADIGITINPPPRRQLAYRLLLKDRFCLVARRGEACLEARVVDWSIFEQHPFIAMSPASSVRVMTDAAFLQIGLCIAPLYECAHLATTGGLVEAGLGITALPQLALAVLANPNLAARPLHRPLLERSIGVVTRSGRSIRPAVIAFLDALTSEAKQSRAAFRDSGEEPP